MLELIRFLEGEFEIQIADHAVHGSGEPGDDQANRPVREREEASNDRYGALTERQRGMAILCVPPEGAGGRIVPGESS